MNFLENSDSQSEPLFSSEEYFRISINLPVAKGREKIAAKSTIAKLQGRFDSYTHSNIDNFCFVGRWQNQKTGKVFRDLIAILTIDVAVLGEEPDTDYSHVVAEAMWKAAESEYVRFKVRQDAFWISVSRVSILEKVKIPKGSRSQG